MKPSISRVKHMDVLKNLRLPSSEIILLGSTTLAVHGLDINKDIDVMASKRLWTKLKSHHKGLMPVQRQGRLFFDTQNGEVEISNKFVMKKFTFDYLKRRAIKIDGYYFMSFQDLIVMYETFRRPKDIRRLKIIKNYLRKNNVIEWYLNEI